MGFCLGPVLPTSARRGHQAGGLHWEIRLIPLVQPDRDCGCVGGSGSDAMTSVVLAAGYLWGSASPTLGQSLKVLLFAGPLVSVTLIRY